MHFGHGGLEPRGESTAASATSIITATNIHGAVPIHEQQGCDLVRKILNGLWIDQEGIDFGHDGIVIVVVIGVVVIESLSLLLLVSGAKVSHHFLGSSSRSQIQRQSVTTKGNLDRVA